MTVMVWLIDAGNFADALPLAAYAIRHQMAMPDQYQRTTACLIAEEFASMALKAVEAGDPVDVTTLREVAELVAAEDMPDEVRAKLHKALGYGVYALAESVQRTGPTRCARTPLRSCGARWSCTTSLASRKTSSASNATSRTQRRPTPRRRRPQLIPSVTPRIEAARGDLPACRESSPRPPPPSSSTPCPRSSQQHPSRRRRNPAASRSAMTASSPTSTSTRRAPQCAWTAPSPRAAARRAGRCGAVRQ